MYILIGCTDALARQKIAAGYGASEFAPTPLASQNRRDETAAHNVTLDNVGRNAAVQSQDDTSEHRIKSLARLIAGGKVDARAYVKDRMHART